jgi:DNA-binding transcriptional MocR family regulator
MKDKPNYYATIPADVRYDNTLTPNAKLLYAEITALSNMNGRCMASSRYFADLYNVSRVSIQKWLKLLEDKKYINREIIYKQGCKQIEKRYITLVNNPCKEKLIDNTNTKVYTNTNITYSNKRDINIFKLEVQAFDTTDKHKEDFLEYWLETNQKGKTKYEMQKTWNTNRRLKTWIRNYNNWWQKNNTSKIDNQLSEYLKGKEYL